MNTERLLILARFLEEKVDPSHFAMETFANSYHNDLWGTKPSEVDEKTLHTCGTTACALGYATLLFPADPFESWEKYCRRIFDVEPYSSDWVVMFGPDNLNDPQIVAENIRDRVGSCS